MSQRAGRVPGSSKRVPAAFANAIADVIAELNLRADGDEAYTALGARSEVHRSGEYLRKALTKTSKRLYALDVNDVEDVAKVFEVTPLQIAEWAAAGRVGPSPAVQLVRVRGKSDTRTLEALPRKAGPPSRVKKAATTGRTDTEQ